MALSDAERLVVLRRNAEAARHAKRERDAARWQQQVAWAKRGATDRVAEIEAELLTLRTFLSSERPRQRLGQ